MTKRNLDTLASLVNDASLGKHKGGPPKTLWGTKYLKLGHDTSHDSSNKYSKDVHEVWKHGQ